MKTKEIKIGTELPSLARVAYQRALDEVEFKPDSSHRDDYAIKVGYSGALLSGYILCGYINDFMVKFFGEKWFTGGEISLSFINKGVRQKDRITIKGTVKDVFREPQGERVTIDFWMEKDDGTKVVVGQAAGSF
ncbi:MAG: MaoC family dehydratase [Dehalococcoidales bacterium]|nr:MaoC family dehydratase [Dehalococcoidales bacterium]